MEALLQLVEHGELLQYAIINENYWELSQCIIIPIGCSAATSRDIINLWEQKGLIFVFWSVFKWLTGKMHFRWFHIF